jgi:tetratricopeptide (TPR) repeat protein
MVASLPNPAVHQALAQARQALRVGDLMGAETVLAPWLARGLGDQPPLLYIAGVLRMHQQRHAEAADLFAQARAAEPGEAAFAFSHGTALQWLDRPDDAVVAFAAAARLKPDFRDAWKEAAETRKRQGRRDAAAQIYCDWLTAIPGDVQALLELGAVLLADGKPQAAEEPLRRGLALATDPQIRMMLYNNLALALRRQSRNADALMVLDAALRIEPAHSYSGALRVETLQELKRYDEALADGRALLARDPENPELHKLHNGMLYRLGRAEEYLKSYDTAPKTRDLLLSKAYFLSHEKRGEDALEVYRQALALDPDSLAAAVGAANSLNLAGRHQEAGQAFDALLQRHGDHGELYGCAAEAAILSNDPQKAVALCQQALAINPYDQGALAEMGTAWRMMEDERDEALNGYDTLVQSYDLEPPDGFSRMEDFNAELNAWLDRMHPPTREYLEQSLRGGTQTAFALFGQGHELVGKLQQRIDQAVARHVAALKEDASHPFLSRRARQIRYAGSWSSRLRDCGFHVNHIHPEGWISSCYYVAVPDAVQDTKARQGWIKFGESSFNVALKNPIRRAIQPVPGRLVLFPSYMWHGTIPFHDAAARTTIAFDAVPVAS